MRFEKVYSRHRVSTKIAIYSNDLSSVLVMRYPRRGSTGLPGGHIDKNEMPDDTLKRELQEELSLSIDSMKRVDFFYAKRIVLAYIAIAPADIVITPTNPKFEYSEWVTKDELKNTNMHLEYIRFTLENWPNQQP